MQLKSSDTRYGTVAITFHWLSAAAILAALVMGFRAAGAGDPTLKASILRLHVPVGILILILIGLRISWRFFDRKPRDVPGTPAWQGLAARLVHGLLYAAIIAMGASGIAMLVLSGAGPILFGGSPAQLPNFWDYPPRIAHGIGAFVLLALIGVHIAAALYHQFVKRDRLMARMGLGRDGRSA